MTLILPLSYSNARFIFTCAGIADPCGFSIGYRDDFSRTPAVEAAAIRDAAIDTEIVTAANLSNQWTFQGVVVTYSAVGGPIVGQDITPITGTDTAPPIPANCSVLVRKNTDEGGRKQRGRLNLPAGKMEEQNVDAAGFITSGVRSVMQTHWNAFHARLVTDQMVPYLYHSDAADDPTEITSFSVMAQIATQRLRMR